MLGNKLIILFFISIIFIFSCKKESYRCDSTLPTVVAPAAQLDSLENYLEANDITDAIKHPSGMYYTIVNQGIGASFPTICSTAVVEYEGYLFSGEKFGSTEAGFPGSLRINETIIGTQYGLTSVKAGGHIILYLPPYLAYGDGEIKKYNESLGREEVIIPANSYMKFIFKVHSIK